MKDRLFKGTKVKYRFEIESPGFDMARDNFKVILSRGSYNDTFEKADFIDKVTIIGEEEKHEYFLCFDTTPFGAGDIIVTVVADVPDEDFGTNGIRTEVDRFRLVNVQPV